MRAAQASPGEVAAARARTRARLERELHRPAPVRPWRPAWSPLALAASLILVLAFAIAGGGVILNAIQSEATPTLIVTLTPAASLTPTPTDTETATPTPTETTTATETATPTHASDRPAQPDRASGGDGACHGDGARPGLARAGRDPLGDGLCGGAASGWMTYRVQAGDTLSGLALNTGTTVAELRRINCLTEDTIVVGQVLYLPRLPVRTPGATVTPRLRRAAASSIPAVRLGRGPAVRTRMTTPMARRTITATITLTITAAATTTKISHVAV